MNNQVQAYKSRLMSRSTREPYYTGFNSNNNLFGSIANSVRDFIPADADGNIISLNGKVDGVEPQWLSLQSKAMQFWAYVYCSPLASVIDKLAEANTNGRLDVHYLDGTPVKNYKKNPKLNRIVNLLNDPNPMQTKFEFNAEQDVFCKIYGYSLVWALSGGLEDKSYSLALFNLNPLFCEPVLNEKFDVRDVKNLNPIKSWNIKIYGKVYANIPASEILIVKDGFIGKQDHLGLPISKVAGLDYMVSNICAAMEADNVLLKKKGPLGIFSHDPKSDMAGWQPMAETEKLELQNELKRYGLSWHQFQYIISKQPVKWNAMSFNVRDLMTKETVRQAIDAMCDRFGFPAELMSGKNATYENRNSAEKFLYQNNIIPYSLRRMAHYDSFFVISTDYNLRLDYNHLPVLQEDIMHAGEASHAESQALDIDWKNDIITFNEYRIKKGYEPVDGMDIYYSDWAKKYGKSLLNAKSNSNPNSKSKETVSSN